MFDLLKPALLIIGLTALAGYADAQGFLHAAQIWQDRKFYAPAVLRSALGFGSGIVVYWIAARYLREYHIDAPEIQALIWFGVTIIGVALLSGRFVHWRLIDQAVALLVVFGIAWLVFRTGG